MKNLKKLIATVTAIVLTSLAGCAVANANEQDRPWLQLVGEGAVPGYSIIQKFGENPTTDTDSDPEDMWSFGGIYTWSTSADIDSVVSSDVDDTQELVIQGLDENWELVTQTITLTGQTKVPIPIPMIRCFRAWNNNGTDIEGTVYIYVDSAIDAGVPDIDANVRAVIVGAANQTEMCIYTIPEGYVGYIYGGYVGLSKTGNKGAIITARARLYGGVFRVLQRQAISGTGSNWYVAKRFFPGTIPARTDLIYRIEEVDANDTGTIGGFTVLLKKIYP